MYVFDAQILRPSEFYEAVFRAFLKRGVFLLSHRVKFLFLGVFLLQWFLLRRRILRRGPISSSSLFLTGDVVPLAAALFHWSSEPPLFCLRRGGSKNTTHWRFFFRPWYASFSSRLSVEKEGMPRFSPSASCERPS